MKHLEYGHVQVFARFRNGLKSNQSYGVLRVFST